MAAPSNGVPSWNVMPVASLDRPHRVVGVGLDRLGEVRDRLAVRVDRHERVEHRLKWSGSTTPRTRIFDGRPRASRVGLDADDELAAGYRCPRSKPRSCPRLRWPWCRPLRRLSCRCHCCCRHCRMPLRQGRAPAALRRSRRRFGGTFLTIDAHFPLVALLMVVGSSGPRRSPGPALRHFPTARSRSS